MSENGEPKHSLTSDVLSLLEDQVELVSLELGYESEQGARRIGALVGGVFLGFIAFALLQVAIVHALQLLGLSLGEACVILAAVYALASAFLILKLARRDKNAGAPLQGTRDEIRKNIEWIRQFLP